MKIFILCLFLFLKELLAYETLYWVWWERAVLPGLKTALGPGSVLSDGGVFFPLHPQCYLVYVPFLVICPSFSLQGLYLGILFGTTKWF